MKESTDLLLQINLYACDFYVKGTIGGDFLAKNITIKVASVEVIF